MSGVVDVDVEDKVEKGDMVGGHVEDGEESAESREDEANGWEVTRGEGVESFGGRGGRAGGSDAICR